MILGGRVGERAGAEFRTRLYDRGEDLELAASTAFGDANQLEREVRAYRDQPHISYVQKQLPAFSGGITVTTLAPAEGLAVDFTIAEIGARTPGARSALQTQAVKASAAAPDTPDLWSIQAELALKTGDFAAATTANDRLLALRPKDLDGLTRRAFILAIALKKDKATDRRWTEVARLAAAANAVDPDAPAPLALFYESFVQQGLKPSSHAGEALIAAHLNLPRHPQLRLALGYYLMSVQRPEEARRILGPLLNDPHTPHYRDAALKIMAGQPVNMNSFSVVQG